jgi:hypothetical protein
MAELHVPAGADLVLQPGVVTLGGGDPDREQRPPVQGQPPRRPVRQVNDGADLVRDRHVGVQVRVPGPGLEVVEARRDQAGVSQRLEAPVLVGRDDLSAGARSANRQHELLGSSA